MTVEFLITSDYNKKRTKIVLRNNNQGCYAVDQENNVHHIMLVNDSYFFHSFGYSSYKLDEELGYDVLEEPDDIWGKIINEEWKLVCGEKQFGGKPWIFEELPKTRWFSVRTPSKVPDKYRDGVIDKIIEYVEFELRLQLEYLGKHDFTDDEIMDIVAKTSKEVIEEKLEELSLDAEYSNKEQVVVEPKKWWNFW